MKIKIIITTCGIVLPKATRHLVYESRGHVIVCMAIFRQIILFSILGFSFGG